MKLVISFGFALLLVLTGAPRSLWSDNTDKIAASAERWKHVGVWRSD